MKLLDRWENIFGSSPTLLAIEQYPEIWGYKRKPKLETVVKRIAREQKARRKLIRAAKATGLQVWMVPGEGPAYVPKYRVILWDPGAPTEAIAHEIGHHLAGYQGPISGFLSTASPGQIRRTALILGGLAGGTAMIPLLRGRRSVKSKIGLSGLGVGLGALLLSPIIAKALTLWGEAKANLLGYAIMKHYGLKPRPERFSGMQMQYHKLPIPWPWAGIGSKST